MKGEGHKGEKSGKKAENDRGLEIRVVCATVGRKVKEKGGGFKGPLARQFFFFTYLLYEIMNIPRYN